MSETYFSWQTTAGRVDAGKVAAWDNLFLSDHALLDVLESGKPIDANAVEPEFAKAFAAAIQSGEATDPESPLGESMEQFLRILISRRPDQRWLVIGAGNEEEFHFPHLLDWLIPDKPNWDSYSSEKRERLTLLLEISSLLDTDPDDEDVPDRNLRLLVCLQLLPDFAEAAL